ncbi:hypothetical protein M9434_003981 [Picochlorum sp. BPE23]|nr:hypothetical protein M9434_003981 [Picochlorum sp. BPE23]KAI8113558.1 hypothetical protein M9435_003556 [Picochlorum sp. BPE23]|eukprot:jgi/Picre1/27416/NNA_000383.t1
MSTENQTIDSGSSENIKTQDAPKKRKPGSPGMYQRLDMPTPESIAQEDFMNNCAVRTILSGVMGTGLGVVFGIFMGTMDTSHIDGTLSTTAETKKSFRQVMREVGKSTWSRSMSYAKGFGMMGALFSGSECIIETYRAKHDMYNSIYAGCTAGAILAHSGGPKAMCVGCASFAAFSALIDKFMDH